MYNIQRDHLTVNRNRDGIFFRGIGLDAESSFFQHLWTKTSGTIDQDCWHGRTSRIAQAMVPSFWLIFPFGKPQPAEFFQPLTKRTYAQVSFPVLRERLTYLVAGFIENDSPTDGNKRLVGDESFKCLLMHLVPLVEQWYSVPQYAKEPLQTASREFGILFTNKVFIIPMACDQLDVRLQPDR